MLRNVLHTLCLPSLMASWAVYLMLSPVLWTLSTCKLPDPSAAHTARFVSPQCASRCCQTMCYAGQCIEHEQITRGLRHLCSDACCHVVSRSARHRQDIHTSAAHEGVAIIEAPQSACCCAACVRLGCLALCQLACGRGLQHASDCCRLAWCGICICAHPTRTGQRPGKCAQILVLTVLTAPCAVINSTRCCTIYFGRPVYAVCRCLWRQKM